jgi:hypothetical protein
MLLCLLIGLSFILAKSVNSQYQPTIRTKIQDFQPYTFIAYGDTRNTPEGDNSGMEATATMIESVIEQQEISFILHCGDMVDSGGSADEYDDYWWPTMEDILAEVPIYVSPGNHEYEALTGGDDLELIHFRNNVDNPNNSDYDETYFSFDSPLGDTHFVILNTEYYFGLAGANAYNTTRQDQQMAWLAADMAANTASRTVVMFHRPLWGVNNARVVDEYRPLREEWHDLLTVNYSVDFVIQGHDHHVYHTVRNDTDFMIMGAGTAALTLPNLNGNYVLQEIQEDDFAFGDTYAISVVTATEEGFEVDIVVENGTTVYEFSIAAPAADIYPPSISSPDDLTFMEGSTGQTISWTVNDAHPDTYTISVDDQQNETGTWTDGQEISFDVSAFTEGTYEIKLEVVDASSNSVSDVVAVEVTASTGGKTSPSLELFSSLIFLFGLAYYSSRKRK